MQAIDPIKRAALGELLQDHSQEEVMAHIPQFQQADIHIASTAASYASPHINATVFNMERGVNCDAIIDFLKHSPALQPFDLILANELDDGCTRSGELDVAKQIGQALDMHYVFALEFIELKQETASKGYHGNAIFSRFPIKWANVFRLPEENNWFFDRQSRIGGRCAIFAELEVVGRPLGVVSIHLENRTDGSGRLRQMKAIYEEAIRVFPNMPILLGGDLNTNTFDGRDKSEIQLLADNSDEFARRIADPEQYEPLLSAAEEYAFEFRQSACLGTTRRKPLPDGRTLHLRLDWFLSHRLKVIQRRIVSTRKADCGFAPAGSALADLHADQISDHNAIWTKYELI